MKTSAIVCAVLAGTLGLSSVASAQSWRDDRGDRRQDRRAEQREDRRDDRREQRAERREQRQEWRQDRREDRAWRQGWNAGYEQPRYYAQPNYRPAPRFHRGGYLPQQYRHGYHVSNWNAHPGLYSPPHGHQWMNVDGEFLLVALATGLIANAILSR